MSRFASKRSLTKPLVLLHFFVVILLLVSLHLSSFDFKIEENWTKIVAWLALILCLFQIVSLLKANRSFFSFEVWLVIFSYLFMFGQIFIVGVLGIDSIYALGHNRPVLDARYDAKTIAQACVVILTCIQCLVFGFLLVSPIKETSDNEYHHKGYIASIILLIIGVPCHLTTSISMVYYAQSSGSYDAIAERAGLADDFSNFFIYGLLCLLFSNKVTKRKVLVIYAGTCAYLALVMMLTGDRRYQAVAIIVLVLAYIRHYKVKLSFKYVWIVFGGYLLLNLFFVLREIRTDSLVSVGGFVEIYLEMLTNPANNIIVQTLYEFGGSIYTVCLAIKYIPNTIEYGLGSTILSGLMAVIPGGFLYQETALFQKGRIAVHLMEAGNTTVGGSLYQDLYGNFGYGCGIIAVLIGAMLSKLVNGKKQQIDCSYFKTRYYIAFYALIHLARASFTEVIRTVVWGLAVLYVVYYVRVRKE